MNASDTHRPPDVKLVFTCGQYDHALRCYAQAREWCLAVGVTVRDDVFGVIKSPKLRDEPVPDILQGAMLEDPEWCQEVWFWLADTSRTWFEALQAPQNAQILWLAQPVGERPEWR